MSSYCTSLSVAVFIKAFRARVVPLLVKCQSAIFSQIGDGDVCLNAVVDHIEESASM